MIKKLPVVTSSAPSTSYVWSRIDGPDGDHLFVDGNQKVTAGNGTYYDPKPNAFSLIQIEDCPHSTPTCRASCYVHELQAVNKPLHDMYRHNSATLRRLFGVADGGYCADQPAGRWWAARLGSWIEEHARGGFRWHVSGDIWDPTYAWWIALVCQHSPSARHWIYTRSHAYTAAFVGVDNLTVNYSVDRDNYRAALPYAAAHAAVGSPVRLAYMVVDDGHVPADLPEGSVIFPDYALRGTRDVAAASQRQSSAWWQGLSSAQRRMICPVDFYGKSEGLRCGPCRKCIDPVRSADGGTHSAGEGNQ